MRTLPKVLLITPAFCGASAIQGAVVGVLALLPLWINGMLPLGVGAATARLRFSDAYPAYRERSLTV